MLDPAPMRAVIFLSFLACAAFAQSKPKLEFDVASIRPSAPVGPATQPGCRGAPAILILVAYDVKYAQLAGPEWLSTPRFDINATAPAGATKEQLPEMWPNLLADRFHLLAHRESREQTHFDLVVAKGGPRMIPAGTASGPPRPGAMGIRSDGSMNMHFPRMTMPAVASTLSNQLHQLVTDATGLSGAYDMQLQWTAELKIGTSADSLPPLTQALEDQPGLRLVSKKGPVDMLRPYPLPKLNTVSRTLAGRVLDSCHGLECFSHPPAVRLSLRHCYS
jgi:uncharacterized protein (TIGR03435 family)